MEKLKLSLLREKRSLQCWEQGPGSVRSQGGEEARLVRAGARAAQNTPGPASLSSPLTA